MEVGNAEICLLASVNLPERTHEGAEAPEEIIRVVSCHELKSMSREGKRSVGSKNARHSTRTVRTGPEVGDQTPRYRRRNGFPDRNLCGKNRTLYGRGA